MLDQPVDELLVGFDDTERRLEVLPRQRKPLRGVMRRADDDEQARVRPLGQLLEPPRVRDAAAEVVDVRSQESTQPAAGSRQRMHFPITAYCLLPAACCFRQSGAAWSGEVTGEFPPQLIRVLGIAAQARRLADRPR